MKLTTSRLCSALLTLTVLAGITFSQDEPFPVADSEQHGIAPEALEKIWTRVFDWVEAGDPVGAEVLIIKNGATIFHEAFGWKDREREIPMEINTIARVRSMTKPFIGTSVLMLREEGKLSLTDPVSKHIPAFDNEVCRGITIEHLLTHTAGFDQPGYPGDLLSYADLRSAVDATGAAGPQHIPGARYGYSDADTATLGCIVAALTDMPVEEFVQKRIFDVLGMSDSMCNLTMEDARRPRVASTYIQAGNGFLRYWDNSMRQAMPFFRASGGIYSTPLDYARFLDMWVKGGAAGSTRLLPEKVVPEALRLHPLSANSATGAGYAWHWQIFGPAPTGSDNLPVFGHSGSDGTLAVAFPSEDLLVFYFTQSRRGRTLQPFLKFLRKTLDV